MKKIVLFFPLLLAFQLLFAQEHLPPDSAAVVKNNVRSAKVFYTGTSSKKHLTHEYRYDSKGRVVWEKQGSNNYYYAHRYDDKNRLVESAQRTNDGALIQKFVTAYYPEKGYREVALYKSGDSARAAYVYRYDSNNKIIYHASYYKGELQILQHYSRNSNGEVISFYDSSAAAHWVAETRNGLLVRDYRYEPGGSFKRGYRFSYNDAGLLNVMTDSLPGEKPVEYKITYRHGQVSEVHRNGKKLGEKELTDWLNDFRHYTNTSEEGEYDNNPLPVPEPVINHNIERDKKGNIVKDTMDIREGSRQQTVIYTYEYSYY